MNDVPDNRLIAEAELQARVARANLQARLMRLRWPLMIGGPVIVLAIIVIAIIAGGGTVSTDDAYVGAARVAVSASVPGRIVSVNAHENQVVKRGDILIQLDDSDYRTAVERAAAELAVAKLQVEALRATYEQTLSDERSAQDTAAYAAREKSREHDLLVAGIASQQDYDRAAHAADEAQHAINAAHQAVAKAFADLGGNAGLDDGTHPRVQQALAQLDRAKLDLGHTRVVAAADGVVTKVEQVQVGSYANTSQPLFWLMSNERWVEANFKENQLANLKPGQAATIKLDAYPGCKIDARVASFSPGTGSAFALLPAENATGNWVKVSQRLPVRLDIANTPDCFLAAGLSAHVDVNTHSAPQVSTAAKS